MGGLHCTLCPYMFALFVLQCDTLMLGTETTETCRWILLYHKRNIFYWCTFIILLHNMNILLGTDLKHTKYENICSGVYWHKCMVGWAAEDLVKIKLLFYCFVLFRMSLEPVVPFFSHNFVFFWRRGHTTGPTRISWPRCRTEVALILGVFAKLRNVPVGFVMSVRLSVRFCVSPYGTTRLPLDFLNCILRCLVCIVLSFLVCIVVSYFVCIFVGCLVCIVVIVLCVLLLVVLCVLSLVPLCVLSLVPLCVLLLVVFLCILVVFCVVMNGLRVRCKGIRNSN